MPAGKARLTSAAVVALAAAAALAFALKRSHGIHHGGPLACSGCGTIGSAIPVDIRRSATVGTDVVINRGDKNAVLEGIAFDELTPGVEILGPLALRIGDYRGRGLAAGAILGFPPPLTRGVARPVRGFVVHPHRSRDDDVELLIGLRPRRRGAFHYRSYTLHYHVGHTRYAAPYPSSMTVCAPRTAFDGPACAAHMPRPR